MWVFPIGSVVKNPPSSGFLQATEIQVGCLGLKDPLEEKMGTHSNISTEKIHGQKNLAGYSPWSQEESDTTESHTYTYISVSFL